MNRMTQKTSHSFTLKSYLLMGISLVTGVSLVTTALTIQIPEEHQLHRADLTSLSFTGEYKNGTFVSSGDFISESQ